MSVLSFPRIYFKGFMEWDPCTFNNNDWAEFPTYDAVNAALNWSFLATQTPPITPANFGQTFRPWAITLQPDASDSPAGARVPAEWNMFGSHSVSFVKQPGYASTITGGDLAYGQPAAGDDPLIGSPVSLSGDLGKGPGRLVDVNPASPFTTQLYFGQFQFGSGNTSASGQQAYRMHSRWINPARIYASGNPLIAPAASIGACFQTGIPFAQIAWPAAGSSPLLDALRQAAGQSGAQGVMIRFTSYVNLYFMNGILNGITAQPRDYPTLASALQSAWQAFDTNGDTSQFFSNPCYSHVVGAIGVWNDGELASVPGGRCLAADAAVAPQSLAGGLRTAVALPPRLKGHTVVVNPLASPNQPTSLGPVAVNIDATANLISLDLGSTMPELGTAGAWPSDLVKADFGPLTFGVVNGGSFTPIATIDYQQYQQSAYEAKAGIVDIPFPDSGTGQLLQNGALAIQIQGMTALLEQSYTAETDTRGIYLDENQQTQFEVAIFLNGAPAANANLMIVKYEPQGPNLVPIPSDQPQLVNFTNGEQITLAVSGTNPATTTNVTLIAAGANGMATVGIAAQSPGFPILAFFPYAGATLPPSPGAKFDATDDAFYTTIRVLPFDGPLPQAFVDLWNGSQDQALAWSFIYGEILYLYDMLFNVMLEYVDLGKQQAVEGSLLRIWQLTSAAAAAESTLAMPITRDMSAGKRLTLQLWIYLAANNYNVPNFSVSSIPQGWSPP